MRLVVMIYDLLLTWPPGLCSRIFKLPASVAYLYGCIPSHTGGGPQNDRAQARSHEKYEAEEAKVMAHVHR